MLSAVECGIFGKSQIDHRNRLVLNETSVDERDNGIGLFSLQNVTLYGSCHGSGCARTILLKIQVQHSFIPYFTFRLIKKKVTKMPFHLLKKHLHHEKHQQSNT